MVESAPPNTQTTAARHTPGPWAAFTGQGVHHRDWYIRADTGRDDGAKPAVAKTCSTGIGSMATVEANARLIAAAPELLDALKRIFKTAAHLDKNRKAPEDVWQRLCHEIEYAVDTIAKAEGRA